MKVVCLGNGESRDKEVPNSAYLIIANDTSVGVDFGRGVLQQFQNLHVGIEVPDALFITHGHADHCCGVPHFCSWLAQKKRRNPLTLLAHRTVGEALFKSIIPQYYYDTGEFKLPFPLTMAEVKAGAEDPIVINNLALSVAPTRHSVVNLAIRIQNHQHAVCCSGDGQATVAAKRLYRNADILIHNTYACDKPTRKHACILEVIAMAEELGVKMLMLTHLQSQLRSQELSTIKERIKSSKVKVIFPEPGDNHIL